jgi:hypothetical protein
MDYLSALPVSGARFDLAQDLRSTLHLAPNQRLVHIIIDVMARQPVMIRALDSLLEMPSQQNLDELKLLLGRGMVHVMEDIEDTSRRPVQGAGPGPKMAILKVSEAMKQQLGNNRQFVMNDAGSQEGSHQIQITAVEAQDAELKEHMKSFVDAVTVALRAMNDLRAAQMGRKPSTDKLSARVRPAAASRSGASRAEAMRAPKVERSQSASARQQERRARTAQTAKKAEARKQVKADQTHHDRVKDQEAGRDLRKAAQGTKGLQKPRAHH